MAEDKENSQANNPKSSQTANPLGKMGNSVKGSFQFDEKDKKTLPHSWVRWALILIPIMLIITLAVLLYAFITTKSEEPQERTTSQTDAPPGYVKPSPLPTVQAEADKEVLKVYFAGKTDTWKDELIDKVPAAAVKLMNQYENAQGKTKEAVARKFYQTLSSNTIDDNDPEWVNFLIGFREVLEEELGKPLYDY